MPCYSPLLGWKDLSTGGITFRRECGSQKMEVACGQCLGCRLDHSRMWAMRIVHESAMYEHLAGNCFITLTYRDVEDCTEDQLRNGFHVPSDWSVHKTHWQKFMKRLRKHFEPQKLKFFAVGEYGARCKHGIDLDRVSCPVCNTGRPHYHACIFNCSFEDLEAYQCRDGVMRYTSATLESIWKYGFVDVGQLNFESAAYVARYSLKKVTGVRADDWYTTFDVDGNITYIDPEFCLMSRGRNAGEGIGASWFAKYKDDVFPSDQVPVPGSGVYRGVPRYYEKLFEISDPLKLEEIKEVRQEFRKAHASEYTPERLMAKYKVCKARRDIFLERSL